MSSADEDQKGGARSKDSGMAFPGHNGFVGGQPKPPNVLGKPCGDQPGQGHVAIDFRGVCTGLLIDGPICFGLVPKKNVAKKRQTN